MHKYISVAPTQTPTNTQGRVQANTQVRAPANTPARAPANK